MGVGWRAGDWVGEWVGGWRVVVVGKGRGQEMLNHE